MFDNKQERSQWKSLKMSSHLENEDLENVPLVRMEDVQPARDRNCEAYCVEVGNNSETCIVDDLEYDNEFIVDNDEDSNIGSMVSIHSEEVQDSDSAELIVPEVLDENDEAEEPTVVTGQTYEETREENPESWPTLEILPGGVIKHAEKFEEDLPRLYSDETKLGTEHNNDNMYACAKCSQSFKFLFCLVKHVRWHELEQKRQLALSKLAPKEQKYVCLHSVSKSSKVVSKTHKRRIPIPKKTKS